MADGALETLFPAGLAGIIYDCDGVMIDSEEANRYFYNKILAYLDLPPMTAEQERFAFMSTARQALERMTPEKYHSRLEEITKLALDYDRDILPHVRLMPHFREFAEIAHKRGLRQGVDTNRTAWGIQRVLDFFSLPNYFDPVISSSVAQPKPSPEGARMICHAWGVEPPRVMFVGDSVDDGEAAHGAGTVFAAFGGGVSGKIEIPNFVALARLLGWGEPGAD